MDIAATLKEMGLELPEPTSPGGNYVSVNRRGNIAYLAIQFPIRNGKFLYTGRLGAEISTREGYLAAQLCALNVLGQIVDKIGVDAIEGLNHIDVYYQSARQWDEAPLVANGASDLFVRVLGDKGVHSRSITGVHKLPRNFCVGLTSTLTLI